MTQSRYKNYTVDQLFLEKRSCEDALRDVKREKSDFAKRYGGQYWADEDYISMARHIESLSQDLSEIDAELFTRRQQDTGAPKGPGSAGNLVAVVCDCRPPRRFKLTGRAYDGGPIICGNCNQPFKLALRESRSEDAWNPGSAQHRTGELPTSQR